MNSPSATLARATLRIWSICNADGMEKMIFRITSLAVLLMLSPAVHGALLGTRQRTITPVALPESTPWIFPSNVVNYAVYGYSSWQWGPGEDEGQQFATMPTGYPGATNEARLLAFVSISDAHIADKESPCQAIYFSYRGGASACYSPVMLSTPQMLDAAVRTANSIHRLLPFDFAISLGDEANGPQHNELRWFIDVMDGKYIIPSSGAHAGADSIDYQKPFQAAGLDPAVPWYAVLGNHDRFWMGGLPISTPKEAAEFTNQYVVSLAGNFMGTIDGTTPYGDVINVGSVTNFIVGGVTNTPTVAADPDRYFLTINDWLGEFFNTSSQPVGHGFSPANVTNVFACYSFAPKKNMPIKVIALDDTMTPADFEFGQNGCLDTNHFNWLTNELNAGQANNQLMIVAAHIPLEYISTNSPISQSNVLAALHSYPNLILWNCGHVHINNILPQPSPDPAHPEYGFWEVETASLRDFPQEFRVFEILRNTDNSVSIKVTDVDPEETTNTVVAKSRGYAVGAARIFLAPCTSLADTNSYAHNAELLKLLTPAMQTVIAGCGGPLGHHVAVDSTGTGMTINFLGTLQAASSLIGPWSNFATNSPYATAATNAMVFYRAVE